MSKARAAMSVLAILVCVLLVSSALYAGPAAGHGQRNPTADGTVISSDHGHGLGDYMKSLLRI